MERDYKDSIVVEGPLVVFTKKDYVGKSLEEQEQFINTLCNYVADQIKSAIYSDLRSKGWDVINKDK